MLSWHEREQQENEKQLFDLRVYFQLDHSKIHHE